VFVSLNYQKKNEKQFGGSNKGFRQEVIVAQTMSKRREVLNLFQVIQTQATAIAVEYHLYTGPPRLNLLSLITLISFLNNLETVFTMNMLGF
jgi:hypothetical protein